MISVQEYGSIKRLFPHLQQRAAAAGVAEGDEENRGAEGQVDQVEGQRAAQISGASAKMTVQAMLSAPMPWRRMAPQIARPRDQPIPISTIRKATSGSPRSKIE